MKLGAALQMPLSGGVSEGRGELHENYKLPLRLCETPPLVILLPLRLCETPPLVRGGASDVAKTEWYYKFRSACMKKGGHGRPLQRYENPI